MEDNELNYGQILREFVKKSEYTVDGVAERLGTSRQNLNKTYFNNDKIQIRQIKEVLDIIDVRMEDFFIKSIAEDNSKSLSYIVSQVAEDREKYSNDPTDKKLFQEKVIAMLKKIEQNTRQDK